LSLNATLEMHFVKRPTKTCPRCDLNLPIHEEYFYRWGGKKKGFDNLCKVCRKEYGKKYAKRYAKELR